MNRMKLAENLYRLRRERGLSQEELADRIGVTRQSVSKWETGQSLPDVDKLVELAALYGVTLDALAGAAPEPAAVGTAQTTAGHSAGIGADGAAGGAAQTAAGQSAGAGADEASSDREEAGGRLTCSPWGRMHYEYKSKRTLFGVPLVHVNIGCGLYRAKGIVAVGNLSCGLISVGILSLGLFAVGALALGVIALAGFAAGLLALGGGAVGLLAVGGIAVGWLAFGGLAVGGFTVGGCSLATYVGFGGYAQGIVAVGDQGHAAEIFLHAGEATGRQIAEAIRLYLPRVPEWLIRIFSRFGV